jgi:hypothetical protein
MGTWRICRQGFMAPLFSYFIAPSPIKRGGSSDSPNTSLDRTGSQHCSFCCIFTSGDTRGRDYAKVGELAERMFGEFAALHRKELTSIRGTFGRAICCHHMVEPEPHTISTSDGTWWMWYVAVPIATRLFGYFQGKQLRKV